MKKIAAALCVLLLCALTGCGKQDTRYTPLSGLDTGKKVVLTIAIPYETNKALNTVANKFMTRYPNVSIHLQYLVDIMGGSIRVESELGHGTAFFIRIEAALVDLPAPEEKPSDHTANLRGKRVLLCEDQPMNAKIIVRLLRLQGVETDTAENGKIGVEKLKDAEPHFYDAVLMDVRMPVMNGLEAAKAIRAVPGREDLEQLPIIALTANAYDSDVRACLDAGMNEHLAKPIDKQTLYEALERQIRS